ncbi:sugar ABC transporter ATP-binding protein [Vannielia litorea]|uniref:sugar ABC transporter ATP-binding protein n=1 Tax=Vannielia litorea TaxID=1217970 RepID=UPI001C983A2C|nr:sugar ABC transporter ATP-binding protein [Vannielia litorea]MBY6049745.1 sugar ABC transporter ATP-binding protein [Vannielia litorea]MBY6077159.1 sugar ABC transporter ATP-binding protein [Vannielia litorea]
MSDTQQHPIGLSIRDAVKVYPGTRALKGVDFDIRMGAVNVLVGENGAGKSTLMKVISGVEPLTEGQITVEGQPVKFASKDDAVRAGIGIVFQELNLFPEMTVAENIFIGHEPTRAGFHLDTSSERARSAALLTRLEQVIDPDTPLGFLKIGQQQIVEIAKALAEDARILILDEPTSALSAKEVEVLFKLIDELTAQGVGIVYISHRLEELIRIGDYITVLRDGEITGSRSMEGVDIRWIVEAMIGGAQKDFAAPISHELGAEVFRAEEVVLPKMGGGYHVDHVSLSVKAGEIVGIYGLMGAGRTELMECIIGRHPSSSLGRYFVEGAPLKARAVADRIARGIALVPEDRKHDGLVQIMAIRENLTLSSLGEVSRGFHIDLKREAGRALEFIKRLTIKVSIAENPVSSLSGGNQQKVVIGKALMTGPKILLMDEPTRGVDVGAKAEIYTVMRQLAAEGLGVLFCTSEIEECMALSDRILVMADGRITGEFSHDAEAADVLAAATPMSTDRESAA